MVNPSMMPQIINLTIVLIASLFVKRIPNWNLRSNLIGAVSIVVPLYQNWKVYINSTSLSGFDSTWFIQMIASLSCSVLKMESASIIGSSNWPISSHNPDMLVYYSCTIRVLDPFPRSQVMAWLSSSNITSSILGNSSCISVTLQTYDFTLGGGLDVDDATRSPLVCFNRFKVIFLN